MSEPICDCIETVNGLYAARCECRNSGDMRDAILWCEDQNNAIEYARKDALIAELLEALKAVVAISDRKHEAWDAAKAAIAKAEGKP